MNGNIPIVGGPSGVGGRGGLFGLVVGGGQRGKGLMMLMMMLLMMIGGRPGTGRAVDGLGEGCGRGRDHRGGHYYNIILVLFLFCDVQTFRLRWQQLEAREREKREKQARAASSEGTTPDCIKVESGKQNEARGGQGPS